MSTAVNNLDFTDAGYRAAQANREMTSELIEVNPPAMPTEDMIRSGVYEGFADVPGEIYYPAPYYSNSFLCEVRRSVAHAIQKRDNPPEATPAKALGTAFHMAVLEAERFAKHYVCGPDVSRSTKEWKAFAAEHAGREILKPDEFDQIRRMADAVLKHPTASQLLTGGQSEVSYFWTDPETGLKRKARADYLKRSHGGVIVDLKSTLNAGRDAFERDVVKYGYMLQSAGYLDGFNLLTGSKTDAFVHLCVEKEAPYAVALYVLDNGTLDLGREMNKRLLSKCLDAEMTRTAPAYDLGIQPAAAPAWAFELE